MVGFSGDEGVASITITNGGSGYTTAPAVTIAPPSGQATATAITSGGAVTGFTINSGGAGYSLVPAVTIAPPSSGTQAIAIARLTGGVVTGFTIINPGSGYTSAPAITIAAPMASFPAGTGVGLIVEAEDPYGNVDTSFSGNVTLALASNPAGAALSGTTTVAASAGVATFPGLNLTQDGTGDTIQATSASLACGGLESVHRQPRDGHATGRDDRAPRQHRDRHRLRPGRHGRGRLRKHRSELQRPGHPGPPEQPRRRHARRYARCDGQCAGSRCSPA